MDRNPGAHPAGEVVVGRGGLWAGFARAGAPGLRHRRRGVKAPGLQEAELPIPSLAGPIQLGGK
jgi:hypothetical protein